MSNIVKLVPLSTNSVVPDYFISDLDELVARVKEGQVKGYCLVYVNTDNEVITGFYSESPLQMVGCLHQAQNEILDQL